MKIKAKKKSKGSKSFMLLEVMVSLAILAIGLLAIIRAFSNSLHAQERSHYYSQATFLLGQKMSELELQDTLSEGITTGDFGEDFPDYSWKVEIQGCEDEENLKDVTITIYSQKKGKSNKLTLSNLLLSSPQW